MGCWGGVCVEETEENEKKRSEEKRAKEARTGDKDKRKEMGGKGWVAWPEQCFLERQRQTDWQKKGREGEKGP